MARAKQLPDAVLYLALAIVEVYPTLRKDVNCYDANLHFITAKALYVSFLGDFERTRRRHD